MSETKVDYSGGSLKWSVWDHLGKVGSIFSLREYPYFQMGVFKVCYIEIYESGDIL